jgi:hypothetical protein
MMAAMAEQRRPGDTDRHRRQRSKNLFVFWALLGMCAVFFVLTIVKMGVKA